jgi:CRISPR-associated protein Csb2
MLTLEIEFLTGVCYAARSQSSGEPDWPVQPDRIFSALTAAWGTRGERPDEQAALEWLERQPAPKLHATPADYRGVGIAYVPPNDVSGKLEVMPDRRRRQARMFPAAIPSKPLLQFIWPNDPDSSTLRALDALARDTAYVGHSSSITRCRFHLDFPPDRELTPAPVSRRVHAGRLSSLRREYRAGRRPGAGEPSVPAATPAKHSGATSVFGKDWIVLQDVEGACPDLRAAAVVARTYRVALISTFQGEIPEFLSGHQPDQSPSKNPHMAIVPLADVGSDYSQGRLMGLAIILPRAREAEHERARRAWLDGRESAYEWREFERTVTEVERLTLGTLGVWKIGRVTVSEKWSLQPRRYLQPSRVWASVTPIVLDRFLKTKSPEMRDQEIESVLASSCVNIGLPPPVYVRPSKHSALRGAPSAYPSGGNPPAWTRWILPGPFANRMLTHAVFEFDQEVGGPVILGAGRFAGLGLCVPIGAKAE